MNLRRRILEYLKGRGDSRLGDGYNYIFQGLQQQSHQRLNAQEVMAALWQLLSEGLVYLDYTQPAPSNWAWVLTERGLRAARSTEYEPNDPQEYLRTLKERIPQLDELVLLYAEEALGAYNSRCYLASSVMLGVASERAFQLLAEAFASWLPGSEAKRFRETFDNPRTQYVVKFAEFRKRIEPHKGDLPPEFADSMALTLDSVLDLLRITRNEAGHPTGRLIDEGEAYINLQMFGRYLEKLYGLIGALTSGPHPHGTGM